MDIWVVLQQAFNGLSVASIYMLVAVGITLVFGLTGIVNFAHGELMMLGAYAVLVVAPQGGPIFVIGLVAALAFVGLVSFALERGLFRYTLKRPVNGFLVSLGLILVIQNMLIEFWTITQKNVSPMFSTIWRYGDLRISSQRVFIIVVTAIIFTAFGLALRYSKVGVALRATALDRETATLMGIPVPRMIMLTFVGGGMLAATGGAFLATIYPISPMMGSTYVVKGFAVAIVGGLGNVGGAMIAAFLLGMAEAANAAFGFGEWTDAVSFALMILMLLLRPQGILRGTEAAI